MSKASANIPQPTTVIVHSATWLPTDPPRPVPELMTWEEVCAYLRVTGTEKQRRMFLNNLRTKGVLRGTKVGMTLKYRRESVERCLEIMERDTNQNRGAT